MPLYEYECVKCGHRTEVIQRVGDPPLEKCSECGGAMKRLLSAPAFQFKGSGWYVTDYAGKSAGKTSGRSEESGGESKSEKGGESKSKSKSKEGGDAKVAAASSQSD